MNALSRTWGMWLVRGIASVFFGVLTIMRPGASIAAIVFVYGFYAVTDGALLLGFAFRHEGKKGLYVARGLLSVAAGLVAFVFPGLTALSFYILIGAWALTVGAAELGIAIGARKEGASVGGLVAAGVLSIAFGAALLALPMAGVLALIGLIAAYAIINGIVIIVASVSIHHLTGAPRSA